MELNIIRQNLWWDNKLVKSWIERDYYLDMLKSNLNNDDVIFLTGLRRIGKTTLMKQLIYYLINERKINSKYILYLTLDDINFVDKSIFDLLEVYREINGIKYDEFIYLFLDEVTYQSNFAQQLKNLYDTWNVKVICSSSIASLLNDNKAFLTGRSRTIEVMPLSYKEFLLFKGYEVLKQDKALNKSYFEEYMKIGGIPEYVLNEDITYLNELINSIIYKDIIALNNVSDEKAIKELFRLLCQRIGKPTSYNKLAKILKISDLTVKKYISYFEKSYLFFPIEKFAKSVNENITSPKKFYIVDLGIKNFVSSNKEKGSDFENLVFIKLKPRNPFYYLDGGIEIDFVGEDYLVEAKYLREIEGKQKVLFDKVKRKEKLIVNDYSYFL